MTKFVNKNTCPSVANYQSQTIKNKMLLNYQRHLNIENNLKVEKKVYYFENKPNFPSSPKKKRLGYA